MSILQTVKAWLGRGRAVTLQGNYWSFSKKRKGFVMKTVTYHWTEIRVLELPDECPTDTADSMLDWIAENPEYSSIEDAKDRTDYEVKRSTDGLEIVDVEEVDI